MLFRKKKVQETLGSFTASNDRVNGCQRLSTAFCLELIPHALCQQWRPRASKLLMVGSVNGSQHLSTVSAGKNICAAGRILPTAFTRFTPRLQQCPIMDTVSLGLVMKDGPQTRFWAEREMGTRCPLRFWRRPTIYWKTSGIPTNSGQSRLDGAFCRRVVDLPSIG